MSVSADIIKTLEDNRAESGTTVILKMGETNLSVNAITDTLGDTAEYFATAGLNASDTDFRVFNVCPYPDATNPSESSILPIRDGLGLVWNGFDYTVTQVAQEVFGQLPISLRLFAYRTSESEENEPNDAGNDANEPSNTSDLFDTSDTPPNTGFFS